MEKGDIEFPAHWEIVLLGDFVHSEKGKKPKNLCERASEECNIPYIDIKAFEKNIVDKYTDGENSRLCNEDDILIVWDGSRSGLVGKGKNGALGSTLARLNFFGINNDYAYYFMKSKYLEINSRAKGAATPHVDPELLWNYQFPLPPIEEQKRIVVKIEELFSELGNSIESLQAAKRKLTLYRQSVLKSAFEGELTRAWREAHQDKLEDAEALLERIREEREADYEKRLDEWEAAVKVWEENGKEGKKPAKPRKPKELPPLSEEELKELPFLPEGWKWVRFNDVTYRIGDIDHKMPKVVSKGFPYISTGNINHDGTIDFNSAKIISKEDFDRLSLKIKPERGDIIFPRYGTIGRNILIDFDKDFLVSYSCAIIKNVSCMNNKFVYFYSLSPMIQKEIQRYIVETTQANIGIASIEKFVFPLMSLSEQNQIVYEIELHFSEIDTMVETIDMRLKNAEQLRQSILKEAFEGKLIAYGSNDEPVSELLHRIQKEKAVFEEEEKIRKKNKKQKSLPKKEKYIMDILQILEQQSGWIKAQQLFEKYTDKNNTDTIETFYKELRDLLNEKKIKIMRKNGSDHLRILKLSGEIL